MNICKKYIATNGTGLDLMMASCCEWCIHDKDFQEAMANEEPDPPDGCSILERVATEGAHPDEWYVDDHGCPMCSEFLMDEGVDTHYKSPDPKIPDLFADKDLEP